MPTTAHRTAGWTVALVVVLLAVVTPRSADADADGPRTDTPAGAPDARLSLVANLAYPISATPAGGRAGLLYVAEREGIVRVLGPGGHASPPVLDIRGLVSTDGEGGLLGIATGNDRDWLYLSYTTNEGANRLVRARIRGDRSLGRREQLLTVPHPATNHHGGDVQLHRGRVYWSLGDGGGSNYTNGNGPNLDSLLGKVLRMRPDGSPVPSNPYVGRGGRDRIWVWGLRNPWRFSIDHETGALWIGDVGQGDREEIDRLAPARQPGANLGWSCWEGTLHIEDCTAPGHVPPVFEYSQDPGCAVTGGYRYRGSRIPALRRSYVYSDYCDSTIRALVRTDHGYVSRSLGDDPGQVISFAEDAAHELYVLTAGGGVYRLDPS